MRKFLIFLLPLLALAIFLLGREQQRMSWPTSSKKLAANPSAQEGAYKKKNQKISPEGAEKLAANDEPAKGQELPEIDWPKFTSRFSVPSMAKRPAAEREARVSAVFGRLKGSLEIARYWQAKLNLPAKGKLIPATLIANLYDGTNRQNPEPLRGLPAPKFLCWILIGYFDLSGDLVKWTASSTLENVAARRDDFYLYISFSLSEALAPFLEFLAVPLPRDPALAEILLPGQSNWDKLPNPNWAPLSEAEYRQLSERLDHESHY